MLNCYLFAILRTGLRRFGAGTADGHADHFFAGTVAAIVNADRFVCCRFLKARAIRSLAISQTADAVRLKHFMAGGRASGKIRNAAIFIAAYAFARLPYDPKFFYRYLAAL